MSEPTNEPQDIEDELDAALAALDSEPLPTTTLPDPSPPPEQAGRPAGARTDAAGVTPEPSTGSPTLDALDESRRPKARTVCEALSELGVVRIAGGSEVLLPRDVPRDLEQQGTQPDHALATGYFSARNGGGSGQFSRACAAADKYIAEREAKRLKRFRYTETCAIY